MKLSVLLENVALKRLALELQQELDKQGLGDALEVEYYSAPETCYVVAAEESDDPIANLVRSHDISMYAVGGAQGGPPQVAVGTKSTSRRFSQVDLAVGHFKSFARQLLS